MELRHLRYFVAVAEELHFRRAAERLHVAQPAVSEQIRKLEAELGVQLFNRTQRSVSLTPSGQAMLGEARRVLRQADVAQMAARNATEDAKSRLRIGYLSDSLPTRVSRAMRMLTASAPKSGMQPASPFVASPLKPSGHAPHVKPPAVLVQPAAGSGRSAGPM